MIVDIINGTVKYHGIEKLGPVDLERVIVKTGLLRKADDVSPRILDHNDIYVKDTERNIYSGEISEDEHSFKVAYVDHAAYDIYKFKDFDLVVTIGDDTSLVASDILYRLNIPIIGITDGDLDKVVENGFVNERSTFIEVSSGFDDIVGHYINDELFLSKDTLEVPFDDEDESVEEFKSVMFNVFKSHVLEKIKDIVPSFIEKDHEYNVIGSYHEVVDENPELVENLDEFIDGFEYEVYEETDEVYEGTDEVYLDGDYDSNVEEIYVEHDLEEISDAELEEIIVEHGSAEYEEVYLDEDDSIIYVDDYSEGESFVEESPVEEIYVEHDVEEIYVEHDVEEDLIYEDVQLEEDYLEESIENVPSDESDDVVYEVLEESDESDGSDESEESEEVDESDGWAEYIEEEFGDSLEESEDSKE